MPPPCRAPPLLRWAQALCCLLALSTAGAGGPWLPGEGDGCVAAWALSLALTLLLGATEATGRWPPRRDVPLVLATAAAVACAAASVIWPLGHLRRGGGPGGEQQALRAVATAASVLATVAYAAEVAKDRARPGQTAPFLATPPGLLKVGEAMVALVLLGLAAEQGASDGPPGWRWCLGIYCVSFAAGVLLVGGFLWGWGCGGLCGWGGGGLATDPVATRRGLVVYAALGAVGYLVASVLWPLYAFREEMGGTPRRPRGCVGGVTCPWDRWVLVAVATALNLVAFGLDLGQTGRLVLLRA